MTQEQVDEIRRWLDVPLAHLGNTTRKNAIEMVLLDHQRRKDIEQRAASKKEKSRAFWKDMALWLGLASTVIFTFGERLYQLVVN